MTPDEELALRIAEKLAAAGKMLDGDIQSFKDALSSRTLTAAEWKCWFAPIFPA